MVLDLSLEALVVMVLALSLEALCLLLLLHLSLLHHRLGCLILELRFM